MEQAEESKDELWHQLTKRRDLVGGTFVRYERGVEVERDTIKSSRIASYLATPCITILGKTSEISFGRDCSRIKRVNERYEIVCQPEAWDTFEFAVAPKGIEIPKKPGLEQSANSNQ